MIAYYLLQHIALAIGLGLCARHSPSPFRLAVRARVLLAISIVPQIIGLTIMGLALLGSESIVFYRHAPGLIGAFLTLYGMRGFDVRGIREWCRENAFIALSIGAGGLVVLLNLIAITIDNIQTLNVLQHDFNVYLEGAKIFAATPSWQIIPDFFGGTGTIVRGHPHSFLYEAYLAHSVLIGGIDMNVPSMDTLARTAQQLTFFYLLCAIAGVAAAMRSRLAIFTAVALVLCVPWVYYILAALSRDAFRMVPLFGYTVLISCLYINFRSDLARRGILTGIYAALAIMSHTFGVLMVGLIGLSVGLFILIRRLPPWKAIIRFTGPLFLVLALSLIRYLGYYAETGNYLGYGLYFDIYKGTWIEDVIGSRWKDEPQSASETMQALFHRYGWRLQIVAAVIGLYVGWSCRMRRGSAIYLGVLIAFWIPLLLSIFGGFSHFGINLQAALLANGRYPLTYFLFSAPLLAVGVERLLEKKLPSWPKAQRVVLVCFSLLIMWNANEAISEPQWRIAKASSEDIEQIRFLDALTQCLGPDRHWLADSKRWSVYFYTRQPMFVYTIVMRPLLLAKTHEEASDILEESGIDMVAFLEGYELWEASSVRIALQMNWERVPFPHGRKQEVWVKPTVAKCLSTGSS